jgi:hypothetical protein
MANVGMGYAMTGENYAKDEVPMAVPNKKVKKPGFIKRWMLRSFKDAVEAERATNQINEAKVARPRPIGGLRVNDEGLNSQPLNLKIYRASGGTIVETSTYDRQKDRHQNQLHIITNDTDLGEGLSKIITMESLRG